MRIATAAVGLIVFFAAFFADEIVFSVAVIGVAAGMVAEALSALNPGRRITALGVAYSILTLCALLVFKAIPPESILLPAMVSGIMIFLILSVITFEKNDTLKIYNSAFECLYITMFMAFIILLRRDFGRYAVIPVFLFSWITDTGAFFCGKFFGRHKLAPSLSPKKTVEGAVGGIIFTILGTFIYMEILMRFFSIEIAAPTFFVCAAIVGAVLSELGDLVASAVKRRCGVKDFGRIFPGHGGFMDRFDSVVFIAPYVYLIFWAMEQIK